jgi:KTSC domain
MTPVKSSSLAAVHHDPATGVLSVKFQSGETYTYAGVSAGDHAKLMSADSVGSHFQKNIRNKFTGVKSK